MLDISVTIQGDKVIIEGLNKLATEFPEAIQGGIKEAVEGITQNAKYFLHAEGAAGTSKYVTSKKTGKKYLKYTKRETPIPAGGYPVPTRSGDLGRALKWLYPGESKTWEGVTRTTGLFEGKVLNISPYARVIHEGTRSSAKFGPRRYMTDALERFNKGDRLIKIIRENIQKAKARAGL